MLWTVQVLQDAILLYLDSMPGQSLMYQAGELHIVKGPKQCKRRADQERYKNQVGYNPYGDDYDQFGGGQVMDSDFEHRADEIQRFKIQTVPPENIKVRIGPGLFLLKSTSNEVLSEQKVKVVTTFQITSNQPNGQELIDSFCEKALQYYKATQAEKRDDSRYLYTPLFAPKTSSADVNGPSASFGAHQNAQSMCYKRYKLSEDKTFKSFFHPEKKSLLLLLEQFIKKTGKFAIPGYPHKLGLLLYGPPGTGKTSLIKAMAKYTKRNVISIPLAKVRTNQELMDLVFDQTCRVEGDEWIYNMPFSKTIFVMEDVDAAIDKVCKRVEDVQSSDVCALSLLDAKNNEEKSKGKGDNKKKSLIDQLVQEVNKGLHSKIDVGADTLNLAGILNVLDGVVDCPERIIIMTTNHPEKLDPALIRPGRINKQMYMGLLQATEAVQMVENYVGPLSKGEKQTFQEVFPGGKISPAALESLCAECSTVQDVLEKFSLEKEA